MSTLGLWDHVLGERGGFVGTFSGSRIEGTQTLYGPRSAFFRWPSEGRAALAWIENEDGRGREVYFCAHLLEARRRIKVNAAPLSSCYVDGDGATIPALLPHPTAIVESSPGREQFYWRLSRSVTPEVGESLNRRLAYAMGGDRSGSDLTQLLRPPGTHNRKYPNAPLVVLREMSDLAYDPDELDRILPLLPQERLHEAGQARRRLCTKNAVFSPFFVQAGFLHKNYRLLLVRGSLFG